LLNTNKLFTQGSLLDTGNSLDMSIEGSGFFQILLPDGQIGYTRSGAFSRNAEGVVTTASGYPLQPEIQIPAEATSINVSSDGIVSVQVPGAVEAEEVGQITLADFTNRQGLQPNGESMLIETTASGAPIVANPFEEGMGRLVQGSLESSNVNVVQQLVDMIETQRAYEVSSKTITSVDEMMRYIAQNL
jgi:flagellar basal-body rod protein FlgG